MVRLKVDHPARVGQGCFVYSRFDGNGNVFPSGSFLRHTVDNVGDLLPIFQFFVDVFQY